MAKSRNTQTLGTGFKTFICPMCRAENTRPKSISCAGFPDTLLALRNLQTSNRVCRVGCADTLQAEAEMLATKQTAVTPAIEPAAQPISTATPSTDIPVYETLFAGLVKIKVPAAIFMTDMPANTTRGGHKVFAHYRHGLSLKPGVYGEDGSVVSSPVFLNRLFFVPKHMRGQAFVFRAECRKKTMSNGTFYIFYDLKLSPMGTKPTHTIVWTSHKVTGIETEVKLHGDVEIWTRMEPIPPRPTKAE